MLELAEHFFASKPYSSETQYQRVSFTRNPVTEIYLNVIKSHGIISVHVDNSYMGNFVSLTQQVLLVTYCSTFLFCGI